MQVLIEDNINANGGKRYPTKGLENAPKGLDLEYGKSAFHLLAGRNRLHARFAPRFPAEEMHSRAR
jgi:hypothetical protein